MGSPKEMLGHSLDVVKAGAGLGRALVEIARQGAQVGMGVGGSASNSTRDRARLPCCLCRRRRACPGQEEYS